MPRTPSRRFALGAGIIVLAVLLALAAASAYVSSEIWAGAFEIDHAPKQYDVAVVALDADTGTITLRAPASRDLFSTGTFGLEWPEGYGTLGAILGEPAAGEATREFRLIEGEPPDGNVRLDPFAYPGDPLVAHGIPFKEVLIATETGAAPAWLTEGTSDTWVIAIHGRTADRREALRLVPVFHAADLPVLVISYRSDRDMPLADGARYRFGATEWRDLEDAVAYALTSGASDMILVGYSMGGGIAAAFLNQSDLATTVRGVILDAPALRLTSTADMQLRDGGVPGFLTGFMRGVAGLRYGINWNESDHLRDLDRWIAPVLLLHGDDDATVTVETSRELARARPDIVTYVEFPGVGHVRGWNEAQEVYLDAVEAFLARVVE
jgi:uncharacterized protein